MSGKPAQNRARNKGPAQAKQEEHPNATQVRRLCEGLIERGLADANSSDDPVIVVLEAIDAQSDLNAAFEGQLKCEVELRQTEQEKLVQASETVDVTHRALLEEQAKSARLERALAEAQGDLEEHPSPVQFFMPAEPGMSLGPIDEAELASPQGLLAMMSDYGEAELRFSDGKNEIGSLLPASVIDAVFRLDRGRLVLGLDTLLLTVLPSQEPLPQLAGVALLIGGEQVAWSPVARPIKLEAGLNLNIAPNVVFG